MSDLYHRMAHEGSPVRMLAWDALSRAQKDQARGDENAHILRGTNNRHVVLMAEEHLPVEDAVEADVVEDETPVIPPNTPKIPEDLDVLTVAQLKELADNEEIDISDVKLKADIVGRIWAVREMRQDEKEIN